METKIKELTMELEEAQQWVHDLQSGMYINCVYCGHRYGPQDEVPATMADALKEHIEQCPKHPMSKLKEDYLEERANVKRLHLQLRHASYQAERDTKELTKVKTDYVLVKAEVEAAGSELLVLQQECIKLKRENVQFYVALEEAKNDLTKVIYQYSNVKSGEGEAAGSELLVLQQECIKLKRENVQLHITLEEAKRENVQLQIALEDQILAYSLDVG